MSTHPIMIDFFSNHLLFRHIFKLGDNVKKGDIVGHGDYFYVCKTYEVNEVTEDNLNDVSMFDKKGDGKGYINLGYKPYKPNSNDYENFMLLDNIATWYKFMYTRGYYSYNYDNINWTKPEKYLYTLKYYVYSQGYGGEYYYGSPPEETRVDYDSEYRLMFNFHGDNPEITSNFFIPKSDNKIMFVDIPVKDRTVTLRSDIKTNIERILYDTINNLETLEPDFSKLYEYNQNLVKRKEVELSRAVPAHMLLTMGNDYIGGKFAEYPEKGISYGFFQKIPDMSPFHSKYALKYHTKYKIFKKPDTPIDITANIKPEYWFWSESKTRVRGSGENRREESYREYHRGRGLNLIYDHPQLMRVSESNKGTEVEPFSEESYRDIWRTYVPNPDGDIISNFNLSPYNDYGYWIKFDLDGYYTLEMDIHFTGKNTLRIDDNETFTESFFHPYRDDVAVYVSSSKYKGYWVKHDQKVVIKLKKEGDSLTIISVNAPSTPPNKIGGYEGTWANYTDLRGVNVNGDKLFINAIKATYGYDNSGKDNKWDFLFITPPFVIKEYKGSIPYNKDSNDIDHMTYING